MKQFQNHAQFIDFQRRTALLALLLVFITVSFGQAQTRCDALTIPQLTDPSIYPNGAPGAPSTMTLDGPWRMVQSSFDNTSDARAREAVVSALAAFLRDHPVAPRSRHDASSYPPQVYSVYILGRTASASLESEYDGHLVRSLVHFRLQFGYWQVSSITPQ